MYLAANFFPACKVRIMWNTSFLQMFNDPEVRALAVELRDICSPSRCRFHETFSLSVKRGAEECDVDADEVCKGVMIGDRLEFLVLVFYPFQSSTPRDSLARIFS